MTLPLHFSLTRPHAAAAVLETAISLEGDAGLLRTLLGYALPDVDDQVPGVSQR